MIKAFALTLGMGFFYLVGAVPAGAVMGLPLFVAALAGWLGYSLGGFLVIIAGKPLADFLKKKLRISTEPNPEKLFWRAWERFGVIGLGLLAPLTIGPQVAAIIGISLNTPRWRLLAAIAFGALPTTAGLAILLSLGIKVVG